MYKPFLHILFYLLPCALRAQQNLVPNPSFEDTMYCPEGLFDMGAVVGWYSPTWGSPDYFHVCYNEPDQLVGVPQNAWGWQWPRTGNAYVGIFNNAYPGTNVREYIQCELTELLEVGERYIVQFFVSRTDSSGKAPDNVGALLSIDPIHSSDIGYLPYVPQVTNLPFQILSDNIDWIRIIDTIHADGQEKYLTIGVFNVDTYWIETEGAIEDDATLYVDDVSIVKLTESVKIPTAFTPNDDGVNDHLIIVTSGFSDGILNIYNRWGRLVYSEKGTQFDWDGKVNGHQTHDDIYYVSISVKGKNNQWILKNGFVHLLR